MRKANGAILLESQSDFKSGSHISSLATRKRMGY